MVSSRPAPTPLTTATVAAVATANVASAATTATFPITAATTGWTAAVADTPRAGVKTATWAAQGRIRAVETTVDRVSV